MQACLQKAGITVGGAPGAGDQQGAPQGGLGGGGAAPGAGGNRGAFAKCLPARLQRLRTTITTPEQTLRQVVNPPQTNITSTAYTIAGVDPATPGDRRRHPRARLERPFHRREHRVGTKRSSPPRTRTARA